MEFSTIKITYNLNQLYLDKCYLESKGIECFIKNERLAGATGHDGYELQVKESDAQKAFKLIQK